MGTSVAVAACGSVETHLSISMRQNFKAPLGRLLCWNKICTNSSCDGLSAVSSGESP